MRYRFDFRPYRKRFKPPLQTNHGSWEVRDGIILRLSDETGIGYGEIAPISWFGSETIEQALDFCRQLSAEITDETIFSIPDQLPACQFGFESACEAFLAGEAGGAREAGGAGEAGGDREETSSPPSSLCPSAPLPFCPSARSPLTYSALLPAGEAALNQWQTLWDRGYRTFKWKIGVYPIAPELKIFDLLTQALPASAKLRLDANGGLSYDDANLWLYTCDNISTDLAPDCHWEAEHPLPRSHRQDACATPGNELIEAPPQLRSARCEIEFIEQPLPVEQLAQMQELSCCYATAIALDESVATRAQIEACYRQGWRGIFVIKPSIAGSPKRLRQFCHAHKIDAVFSSAFETAVGRQAALKLATELSSKNRAVGFGVNHWFEQDEQTWLEQLWQDR